MANRYWVGGTGTWDATSTANWSATSGGAAGASAPTTSDAVIFDANSNTGTNDFTVTLTGSPNCVSINTTGIDPTNAMTIAGTGSLTIGVGASTTFITLTNKVLWTHTGTITFVQGSGTCNIFTAGVSIASSITFGANGAGCTFTFNDNFTCTGTVLFANGILATTGSNKTVSFGRLLFVAGGGANTRIVNLGAAATINITGNAATVLDVNTPGTGNTWGSPLTINFTYSGGLGTRSVILNNNTVSSISLNVTAGSDTFTSAGAGSLTIKDLTFSGFTGTWAISSNSYTLNNLTLGSGMTTSSTTGTIVLGASATWIGNGVTLNCPFTLNSSVRTLTLGDNFTFGSTYVLTLTSGTIALGAFTLTAGRFSSSGTATRAITRTTGNLAVSGNAATILTLTGTGATYGSGLTVSCTYAGSTGTRTINSVVTGVGISVTAGADTVIFTAGNGIGSLDFTGFTGTWSNVGLTIVGSLTVSSDMTVGSGTSGVTLAGTGTVTTNGKTLDFPVVVNGAGITVTLGGAVTLGTTRTFTLTQGSLVLTSNTLSTGVFTSSGTSTRAVTRTSGNIVVTGNSATVLTLTGSGASYGSGLAFNCNYSGSTGTRTFNVTATGPEIDISNGTDTVTFTASNSVGALDFTGFSGTWANVAMTLNRTLTLTAGMTLGAGAGTVTFTGTLTLNSLGKTFDFPVTVGGGTFTLGESLTLGALRRFTLSAGAVYLSSYTLTADNFFGSGASTRSLNYDTGAKIVLTGNNQTIWDITNSTNYTVTGVSRVELTYAGSVGTRVVFDAGSAFLASNFYVTAGTDTVSVISANDLNFTGFSGTLANDIRTMFGSLTISSGMTLASGANATTFDYNVGSSTSLTTNGKTFDFPITKSGSLTLNLQDDLTLGTTRVFTLNQGGLALGANTLSTGILRSNSGLTRSITRTTGNVFITGNAATILNMSVSGATYGSGMVFDCNYSGSVGTRTLSVADANVSVKISAGTDIVTLSLNNSLTGLDFTGFSGTWNNVAISLASLTVSTGMTVGAGANIVTFARSGSITSNGKTLDFPVTINGAGITTTLNDTLFSSSTFTLTQGTLALNSVLLSVNQFVSSGTLTRAVTTGAGAYIELSGDSITPVTLTGSGATYASDLNFNCYFNTSTARTLDVRNTTPSFTIGGTDTVQFTTGNTVGALTFDYFSGTWTNVAISIARSLAINNTSLSMTVGSGTNAVTFTGTGSIDCGLTLLFPVTINGASANVTATALYMDLNTLTLTQGSLTLANDIYVGSFSSSNTNTRAINFAGFIVTVYDSGATAWNCATATNLTTTGAGRIIMLCSGPTTFAGGGATWPVLENNGLAALTITGNNTFAEIFNSVVPTTFTFESGSTQTVTSFNVNGYGGNFVTINSTTPGVQATLSKSSGVVQVQQCNIQDSNATGGASWLAAASINSGNNTGWIFGGGEFLMFFM